MIKIYPIIEGPGEVKAVPKLLYRILHKMNCYDIHIGLVQNAHGQGNLTCEDGLERFVRRILKEPDCGAILILMDAEKVCPLELARNFSTRIEKLGVNRPVVIAFPKFMYENWLIASVETMRGVELPEGRQGIRADTEAPVDVESQTGAKSWLTERMPRGIAYKETLDQEALTQMIDIDLVHQRSRSFRRLYHAMEQAIEGIRSGRAFVSPVFDQIT